MKGTRVLGPLAAALLSNSAFADTTDGSCVAEWTLVNFQPKSISFLEAVPSSSYHARATIVVLLASWCSVCQNQASGLEVLRRDLAEHDYSVDIVAINMSGAESTQEELVTRASFDLLQDTAAVNAWSLQGGKKGDFFLYRAGGSLAPGGYLAASGPLDTNLSTAEGYANLRQAIVAAHDLGPGATCGEAPEGGLRLPSDFGQDAHVNVADAISLLGRLFQGATTALPCEPEDVASPGNNALLDANGDGKVDLTDAVHLLAYLFRSGPPPALGAECVRIVGCTDACDG